MKAIIEICMDNAAFEDDPQGGLACVLRELAERCERPGGHDGQDVVSDFNGNKIGTFKLEGASTQ